jgi:hypothetical protein
MKKLIAALTTLTMLLSISISVNADLPISQGNHFDNFIAIDSPEEVLPPSYYNFEQYGFSGYYDYHCFDGENSYMYNPETGESFATGKVGFWVIEENGVWYMYSKRIEGEEVISEYWNPGMKKAPLADVLASVPRYEYKMSDMATVQRFFRNEDIEISLATQPYLDHNADRIVNSVDLSLIKYELLH